MAEQKKEEFLDEIEDSDNPQECTIDSDCPNQSRCIEKDGLSQCYIKRDMEAHQKQNHI